MLSKLQFYYENRNAVGKCSGREEVLIAAALDEYFTRYGVKKVRECLCPVGGVLLGLHISSIGKCNRIFLSKHIWMVKYIKKTYGRSMKF